MNYNSHTSKDRETDASVKKRETYTNEVVARVYLLTMRKLLHYDESMLMYIDRKGPPLHLIKHLIPQTCWSLQNP